MKIRLGRDPHVYDARIDNHGVLLIEEDEWTWMEAALAFISIVEASDSERRILSQSLEAAYEPVD